MNTVESAWKNLDIYTATQALKTFGTGILPSHWLEMAKSRLYDGDQHAAWTIHLIMKNFLAAFSPVCPFFCHHISTTLYNESAVDIDAFSEVPMIQEHLNAKTVILKLSTAKFGKPKKKTGYQLNAEIEGILIPDSIEEF